MPLSPAEAERLRASERSLAVVRLAAAVLVAAVVLLLPASLPLRFPTLAAGAGVAGLAYAAGVLALVAAAGPRLPPGRLAVATFATDTLLLAVLTTATGGLGSPFEVAWYLLLLTAAVRFDGPRSFLAGLAAVVAYAFPLAYLGQALAQPAAVGLRLGFLLLGAMAAAALGAETARQMRLREQMDHRVREAQSAEAKFRGLLQAAPDAIVIVNREGRIVLVNAAAERTFGYTPQEMLGQAVELLIPDRFKTVHVGHRGHYFESPRARAMGAGLELFGRRKDGHEFPVEVSLSPLDTEEGLLVTSVIRDVTDRKRAESDRQASMDRLRELERLKELDAFKTQFINMAAHELGTPLTPIRLQVHLLKGLKDLPESSRKSVDILDRNVERLGQLVQDVLEVARLQAGRLGVERKAMDLNRVILESVESFQEPARQAGLRLEMRLVPELGIEGDAKRLTQVMFNLLSNAIKFTPRGGTIVVESGKLNEMAVVHVRDTGVGLKSEDIPHLFQPFSQVGDLMQRTKGGTGLGLYISRGIVELHGGRMWAQSPGPGLGSAFSFAVPVRALPTHPPRAGEAQAGVEVRPAESIAERARELI